MSRAQQVRDFTKYNQPFINIDLWFSKIKAAQSVESLYTLYKPLDSSQRTVNGEEFLGIFVEELKKIQAVILAEAQKAIGGTDAEVLEHYNRLNFFRAKVDAIAGFFDSSTIAMVKGKTKALKEVSGAPEFTKLAVKYGDKVRAMKLKNDEKEDQNLISFGRRYGHLDAMMKPAITGSDLASAQDALEIVVGQIKDGITSGELASGKKGKEEKKKKVDAGDKPAQKGLDGLIERIEAAERDLILDEALNPQRDGYDIGVLTAGCDTLLRLDRECVYLDDKLSQFIKMATDATIGKAGKLNVESLKKLQTAQRFVDAQNRCRKLADKWVDTLAQERVEQAQAADDGKAAPKSKGVVRASDPVDALRKRFSRFEREINYLRSTKRTSYSDEYKKALYLQLIKDFEEFFKKGGDFETSCAGVLGLPLMKESGGYKRNIDAIVGLQAAIEHFNNVIEGAKRWNQEEFKFKPTKLLGKAPDVDFSKATKAIFDQSQLVTAKFESIPKVDLPKKEEKKGAPMEAIMAGAGFEAVKDQRKVVIDQGRAPLKQVKSTLTQKDMEGYRWLSDGIAAVESASENGPKKSKLLADIQSNFKKLFVPIEKFGPAISDLVAESDADVAEAYDDFAKFDDNVAHHIERLNYLYGQIEKAGQLIPGQDKVFDPIKKFLKDKMNELNDVREDAVKNIVQDHVWLKDGIDEVLGAGDKKEGSVAKPVDKESAKAKLLKAIVANFQHFDAEERPAGAKGSPLALRDAMEANEDLAFDDQVAAYKVSKLHLVQLNYLLSQIKIAEGLFGTAQAPLFSKIKSDLLGAMEEVRELDKAAKEDQKESGVEGVEEEKDTARLRAFADVMEAGQVSPFADLVAEGQKQQDKKEGVAARKRKPLPTLPPTTTQSSSSLSSEGQNPVGKPVPLVRRPSQDKLKKGKGDKEQEGGDDLGDDGSR